ncbi:MAG: FMN-binding protein [Chloroflexi bacterium]|nr:FMN-binding protein [Chloroflexota bacterium]MBI3339423.1 FMN-binding protein [Chloroflexota bacterium]
MSKNQPQQSFNLKQTINKFLLSGFVVIAFIAYAIHQRLTNSNAASTASSSSTSSLPASQQQTSASSANTVPQPASSSNPAPAANQTSSSTYKNGTFTGPQVDAYYGIVQVEAIVQNGKIADVQFLEYPNERQTSVRINSIAMPYLQQEAVQAQSANVDLVSGATLTSQAFIMSLQSALNSAKN